MSLSKWWTIAGACTVESCVFFSIHLSPAHIVELLDFLRRERAVVNADIIYGASCVVFLRRVVEPPYVERTLISRGYEGGSGWRETTVGHILYDPIDIQYALVISGLCSVKDSDDVVPASYVANRSESEASTSSAILCNTVCFSVAVELDAKSVEGTTNASLTDSHVIVTGRSIKPSGHGRFIRTGKSRYFASSNILTAW